MPEPLEGIRVLEVATATQGPAAALYLSDMGALVIKVEPPEGDPARFHRGVNNDLPPETLGSQFVASNRGKRSMTIDAHSAAGAEVLRKLVAQADVLVSNYREVALERMGLGYETLRAINPRLVYAVVNGFGPLGPEAGKKMVDGAAQARGGLASVTGFAEGGPLMPGSIVADTAGAMQLALGIMTALVARERFGVGQKVQTSSYGAQLWLQLWEIHQSSMTGHTLRRAGPHHPNIPGSYGVYETADGEGIFLAFAQTEEAWQAFCTFAGQPDLGVDERWNTLQKRMGMSGDMGMTAGELRPRLRSAFQSRTRAEWAAFLRMQPDIIWDIIATYDDVLSDEQARANGYIVEMDLPVIGKRKVVGNLVRLSETPGSAKGPPPEWGQHTEEILLELGYDWDAITGITEHTKAVVRQKFIDQGLEPPF